MSKTYLSQVTVNDVTLFQSILTSNDRVIFESYPDNRLIFTFTHDCLGYHHKNVGERTLIGKFTFTDNAHLCFKFDESFLKNKELIGLSSLTLDTSDFIKAEAVIVKMLLSLYRDELMSVEKPSRDKAVKAATDAVSKN